MKIYKITNKVNGRLYIGQTSLTIQQRYKNHCKSATKKVNRYLYDAMNHYGYEAFGIEEIETTTKELVDEREIFWIAELGTLYPSGYNMTAGGGGGYTLLSWTDEKRRLLYAQQAEKRRGPRPPEWKAAIKRGAKQREASMSREEKRERARRAVETARARGYKSPGPKPKFGKENPNHVSVDVEKCKRLIRLQWKLKDIAPLFQTTTVTISAKLKEATGKSFIEWRREYGIRGSFGRIQRLDSPG